MLKTAALAAVGALAFAGIAQAQQVDPNLTAYKAVSGVSGSLKSIGSDTLNNLMTLWAEGFMAKYPNVKIEIEGKGSSTAPPALIAGTAQFGPMSREMKKAEIDEFEKKFGYKPS
ncbi:MAG: phosphate-binding protein, partial [Alphaproteobacteria bacterium]|nr:phosphate-binding protein [Alphaproteobacteria bacterium]